MKEDWNGGTVETKRPSTNGMEWNGPDTTGNKTMEKRRGEERERERERDHHPRKGKERKEEGKKKERRRKEEGKKKERIFIIKKKEVKVRKEAKT